jgi:hypothetical protein
MVYLDALPVGEEERIPLVPIDGVRTPLGLEGSHY